MKKKNLTSLRLGKKNISNFQLQTITGGTGTCYAVTHITEEISDIISATISWAYNCMGEEPITSSACANTQNDDSCNCTVA